MAPKNSMSFTALTLDRKKTGVQVVDAMFLALLSSL